MKKHFLLLISFIIAFISILTTCSITTPEFLDRIVYASGWVSEINVDQTVNQITFINMTSEPITALRIAHVTGSGSPLTSTEPYWPSYSNLLAANISTNATSDVYTIGLSGDDPTPDIIANTSDDFIWFKVENSAGNKYCVGSIQWVKNSFCNFYVKIKNKN